MQMSYHQHVNCSKDVWAVHTSSYCPWASSSAKSCIGSCVKNPGHNTTTSKHVISLLSVLCTCTIQQHTVHCHKPVFREQPHTAMSQTSVICTAMAHNQQLQVCATTPSEWILQTNPHNHSCTFSHAPCTVLSAASRLTPHQPFEAS